MTFNLRNRLCLRTALVALCLLFVCDHGELNGQPPVLLGKLDIDYQRGDGAPMPIGGYGKHYAYLYNAVSVKGRRWERLVRVIDPERGSIGFPALRQNEIVPLFGALYRVESAFPPLKLLRLKAEDVPKGIAVEKDSVVIPMMRDAAGFGKVGSTTVFVTSIAAANEDGPIAKVKINDIRKNAEEVRPGDVLQLDDSKWTVRAVVPPDAKQHVLGWVELGLSQNDAAP